jgi:hypothetical protein
MLVSKVQESEGRPPLPTTWSLKDKCSLLEVSSNGIRVSYKGQGKNDSDAGTVRANHPISPSCGIFYFEVYIVSKGRDGYIGIGICTSVMQLTRLPGWERNTFGYHGDDGNLFRGSGTGKPYGPTYTTADVVGCCVNFINNTLFFTKNGIPLGEAATEVRGTYYPCVGLRTPGEIIEANFGQKPFVFDFEQYLRDEKQRVLRGISTMSYPAGETAASSLVLSYLIHHGYSETVRLFARDIGAPGPQLEEQLMDIQNRQSICSLVRNGEIDKAIAELNRLYPDFLQNRQDILFKLLCQKFIEMIKHAPIEDTMMFGQMEMYPTFMNRGPQYSKDLEEVFSLLAYIDPYSSPMAYLLDEKRREPIVSDLNCALLVHTNRPAIPQLEKVVRQTCVVIDEVVNNCAGPAAIFLNVKEFINDDQPS